MPMDYGGVLSRQENFLAIFFVSLILHQSLRLIGRGFFQSAYFANLTREIEWDWRVGASLLL